MNTRYFPIPKENYILNRKNFCDKLEPRSIAFFNSNDIYPISADSTFPFQQSRDIFYLTGVDQEETVLVLFPDAYKEEHREILFLRETNATIAVWEGAKLTKEQATELTGIKNIFWLSELPSIIRAVMAEAENVYVNQNEHYRADPQTETREDRFVKTLKNKYPGHTYKRSNPILQYLRSIKSEAELKQLQIACDITEKGFRRVLDFVKEGVWEFEIEAEFSHEFLRHRSRGFAYTPIVASGNNANVLHYIENNQQCKTGDLILMDVGAEYGNYASDMTRTIPVSGKYSVRQKEVYEAVLRVKNQATTLLVPGNNWHDYHKEVGKIMTQELLQLGLLTQTEVNEADPKWPAYKKYFMHGTSHHMGLDTHDYGLLNLPFEPNMVLTVEPGIYIPEEGFGIRVEDDVVIQANGEPFNLMRNIPIEMDEIEDLMNS